MVRVAGEVNQVVVGGSLQGQRKEEDRAGCRGCLK